MAGYLNRLLVFSLSIFFRLLYHPFAWTYDWVAATVSWGKWNDWVRATLPYLDDRRTLELGFGPGHLQKALLDRGIPVFGLDESMPMARQAGKRLRKSGCTPGLARGLAQHLPFPAATFGQLVATFPTEYIVHPATLSEAYRVLAPGGTLLILPAAWITGRRLPDRWAAWLFRVTHQSPDKARRSWVSSFVHPLEQAGFVVQVERINLASSALVLLLAVKPSHHFPPLSPAFSPESA
jgi:ubiquinone/menaquinone biosynthesis C-methylase UbiE